jgi:REP element-mobilizing transposase RayT
MARKNRVKTKNDAYYHVMSRIAHQTYLMDDAVKRKMLDVLYTVAEFCGVIIGTYMLMDDHFHILVHVPADLDKPIQEDIVVKRIEVLYGKIEADRLSVRWERMRREGREAVVEVELDRYRRRMRDISEFVKTFKQRVTQWYNKDRGHAGTLWAGRFKGPIIEEGEYLATCMKYIHNNPVSAGMVSSSSDYPWGAPGAARRGDIRAQESLSFLHSVFTHCEADGRFSWENVVEPDGRDRRFSNGVVIGSPEFVKLHMPRTQAGSHRHWKPNHIVGNVYSSHGQHSAPIGTRAA